MKTYLLTLTFLAAVVLFAGTIHGALVHRYTFNGNANDSQGTANGTLQNGATISLAGQVRLDGINDYVSLAGPTINIDSYTDATFESWFTLDTTPGWQRLFDFGRTSGGNGGNYIFYSPTSGFGDNRAAITNSLPGGGNEDVAVGGGALIAGQEYHVAVVVDDGSNGGSDTLQLYINGQPAGSTALTRTMSGLRDTLAYLGRSLYSADPYFDGSINEFRIYNHALTPASVLTSFETGPVLPQLLAVDVYTSSGQVVLKNTAASSISFKHYSLTSEDGTLDVANWNSLSDQGLDTLGPGSGQSWDEAGGSDTVALAEYFLAGSSSLSAGSKLYLGAAFDPGVVGIGNPADLKFEFALNTGEVISGQVNYIDEDADFDNDGDVDGRDFLRWQRNHGITSGATNSMGDANGDGTVDRLDLQSWQAVYGTELEPLAASTAVPEPLSATILCCMGLAAACLRSKRFVVLACLGVLLNSSQAELLAATYHVERLTSDLHIPVYATTAPGDNNRIFVVELGGTAADAADANPITTGRGRIVIYDRTSGQVDYINPYLEIADTSLHEGFVVPEVGLFSLAFHPDFQTNGKFYVNVAVDHTGPAPTVDTRVSPFKTVVREYTVASPGGNQANPTQVRTIFELNQPQFNHNGSWIGFNPQEVAGGENYLYITQGDGGDQHDPANYGQNFDSWFASIMRVDIDGDSFPADSLKNYAIPTDNPFVGVAGADELWAKGLRNPWRASFDRETGDMWIGDVGQGQREEIDFIPNDSPGGQNFGWRLREGSVATPTGGVGGPAPTGNVNPVYEYLHNGTNPNFQGRSVTGGYVYRGSVEEFQGRYFFGDAETGHIWSFDPANPAGTVMRMNDILAPSDGQFISIVSFAEDENGELLILDGTGQMFQIVPNLALTLNIDRESGTMAITNDTGTSQIIRGYSLESPFGSINTGELTPITGNYDSTPGGDGSVDSNDDWQITSQTSSLFSEASLGDGGTLAPGGLPVVLSDEAGWIPSPKEDLRFYVTLSDGSQVEASVIYTGNDGEAFTRGDLNFDGAVDENDWPIFIENNLSDLSSLSFAAAYGLGDLDGDKDNDIHDFLLFETDFDAANGLGAFQAMFSPQVPEPTALMSMLAGCVAMTCWRRLSRARESAGWD